MIIVIITWKVKSDNYDSDDYNLHNNNTAHHRKSQQTPITLKRGQVI